MDHYFALAAAFATAHLGVAVPVIVVACLAYLVGNDVLDVLLVEKHTKGSASAGMLVAAVLNDAASKQAAAGAALGVVTAVAAGGDLKAQIVTALVGVALANASNLEASTRLKLAALLS